MIAWVSTPEGEGALVAAQVLDLRGDRTAVAIVLIDEQFRIFRLIDIKWLRWPE